MGRELRISALLLLVIAAAAAVTADIPSLSSYQNFVAVDPKYELYWTADTAAARPKISFAVRAATKGFVAFGISEVGGMVGTGKQSTCSLLSTSPAASAGGGSVQ